MCKNTGCCILIVVALLLSLFATAQEGTFADDQLLQYPSRYLHTINSKADYLQHNLEKRMEQVIERIDKQERRLRRRLVKKNPALAASIFEGGQENLVALQKRAQNSLTDNQGEYSACLDTLNTSLRFLQKGNSIVQNQQLEQSIGKLTAVQQQFTQAATFKQYLTNREAYLKQQLSRVGMVHQLKQYNKELYYYSAQVNEYKSLLNNSEALERKVIALLSQTKGFAGFFAKYSVIGSLFASPSGGGGGPTLPAAPGLQTTQQVYATIQQTALGNGNSLQGLQSSLQAAQTQIESLKNKIMQSGNSSSGALPDFKPNNQKVKPFWKRLEFGSNLQSIRGSNWLPAATQLGLSIGYKLNDKSVVGIGVGVSANWGKDIRHISPSYQGASVRSFLDYKIKKSFWLSGGFEMNYLPIINKIEALKELNAWKQSGLIGISKKYKAGKKIQGKVSLLWDYLSYSQIPKTQPILFRFGYTIN